MTDLSKGQSSTRTTPGDITKNQTLPNKGVGNKDSEIATNVEVATVVGESKSNEVRVEGKVAENLASLTQLLLQNKTQFTLSQLSEILNVPIDSSTQGLLEKLNMLLKGKPVTAVGHAEKDVKDSIAGVKKALAELLSQKHGVLVNLDPSQPISGATGAQADHPGRRHSQQMAFNATAISEPNNSILGVNESGGSSLQHGKPRESSEQHKTHRRTSGHKDLGLGLQEPLSAKAKVQNYLERFDQDSKVGNTGISGFKAFSQPQWK